MSTTSNPYVKVYTVKIDRIASENNRWYYKHKGEEFDCAIVSKEGNLKKLYPTFLVLGKDDDGYNVPKIYRTIRPLECVVVFEKIIDNRPVYDWIENYNVSQLAEVSK